MLESTRQAIVNAQSAVYEIRERAAMCSVGEKVALLVYNFLIDAGECDELDEAEGFVDQANDLVQTEYGKLYDSNPSHYDIKTLDPLGSVTLRLAQDLGHLVAYGTA